jgi:hypothetical protein
MKDQCEREVIELHQFFQEWLAGALPDNDETFGRVTETLVESFALIGPDGQLTERGPLLAGIRQSHGARPDLRMWIENFRFHRQDGNIALTTYQEWQETKAGVTARISTALFREKIGAPNDVEWLHVHETWLAKGG